MWQNLTNLLPSVSGLAWLIPSSLVLTLILFIAGVMFAPRAVEKAGEVVFSITGAILSPLSSVLGKQGAVTWEYVGGELGRLLRSIWEGLKFLLADVTDNKTSSIAFAAWTAAAFLSGMAYNAVKHPPLPEPVSAARCDAKIDRVIQDLHARFKFIPK